MAKPAKEEIIENEEVQNEEVQNEEIVETATSSNPKWDKMVSRAVEAGLPKPKKGASPAYLDLWAVYVRFIDQSPEKWDIEKDVLLEKLENIA